MHPAPLTPELAAAAPGITARLGVVLRALYALIASAFLRDPRHVALILPLCRYISRTLQRLERVMACAAAGTLRPSRSRPRRLSGSAPTMLPRRRAWLVETLRHHAAGYASQLNHLLDEPDAKALLAATPQAQRLLRPLCHLLGIQPDCLKRPPSPRTAQRASRPSRITGKGQGRAAAPIAAGIPRSISPLARPAPLREPGEARAEWRATPQPPRELCPRLVDRWPFAFLPSRRPT